MKTLPLAATVLLLTACAQEERAPLRFIDGWGKLEQQAKETCDKEHKTLKVIDITTRYDHPVIGFRCTITEGAKS